MMSLFVSSTAPLLASSFAMPVAMSVAMSSATSSLMGFYLLGLVAIVASLRVIMHPNPVHAILAMIVSLLAVAGIFFLIGASFAGALEIIVYAGAILVLFVFVIMMLNLGQTSDAREARWLDGKTWAVPVGVAFVIALILFAMIADVGQVAPVSDAGLIGADEVTAQQVGIRLFTNYGLLVEVAALLLLGALVSAYHIGKKAIDDENVSHNSMKRDIYDEQGNEMTVLEIDTDSQDPADLAVPYRYGRVRAEEFLRDDFTGDEPAKSYYDDRYGDTYGDKPASGNRAHSHLTQELTNQAKLAKKVGTDDKAGTDKEIR